MAQRSSRIDSLDIVRGLVMVLMAIDHVRVYAGVPAGGSAPSIFFTRWITHFCAPVFVMFAGTGAYFHGKSLGDRFALGKFLAVRGILLVILELTVIRLAWTFNLNWSNFTLAGVIWMLGWCMVLLGAIVLTPLSARAIGWLGVAVVVGQPLFAFVHGSWWQFIYPSGGPSPFGMAILYVIVPWIGVMMAGYGFGVIMSSDAATRRTWCIRIGLAMTLLFFVIATVVAVVNVPPAVNGRVPPPLWARVLSQNKYPASPLFLMMTLGPAILLLPFVEGATGRVAGILRTFGRVPLFYYLLHIPLIHLASLAMAAVRGDGMHYQWYATAPYASVPAANRWSLGQLYLVWALVVSFLYVLCAWYAKAKAARRAVWMSYI